ncbi:MAG: HNH endonuclease, partial [Candidatus Nanopelagicales bacterium]
MAGWDVDRDAALRVAAIAYVNRAADASGGTITRAELEAFTFDGQQIKLIDHSRGIRNPVQLPATLSVLSNPTSKYDDGAGADGLPRYNIRSGEWRAGDNRKLHAAYELSVPIIWLETVTPGRFVVAAPVYLVDADEFTGQYTLALTSELRSLFVAGTPLEARYVERITRQRLHQPMFRARIMDAYAQRCTICALGHATLLDAAHITPDSDVRGVPEVSNGLALCKIHHAAFDSNIIGIRPD